MTVSFAAIAATTKTIVLATADKLGATSAYGIVPLARDWKSWRDDLRSGADPALPRHIGDE